METIKALLTRVSSSKLIDPYPSKDKMDLVYQSALRAPDHGWLRPWHFIEITGGGRIKLGEAFVKSLCKTNVLISEEEILKYKSLPFRAPMVIVLVTKITETPKVPVTEQIQSTAAAAQNMMLAIHDMGFGAIWKTGAFTSINNKYISQELHLSEKSLVIGYLYIGTSSGLLKKIPKLDSCDFVTCWN
jgi:nitroreductase